MSLVKSIKERAGEFYLGREQTPERTKSGSTLFAASSVAILYNDVDEDYYKKIRSYVKLLHESFDVQRVCALGYVDNTAKELPRYQVQKLEYMYFTKSDLNWHLKPTVSLMHFIDEKFDVLIDLSTVPSLPLRYILKASHAGMKVGTPAAGASDLLDFMIETRETTSPEDFWNQALFYLSNLPLR